MLESKIEQLTAAVVAMTARLDRFNSHFEYVLEQQNANADGQHTPEPPPPPPPAASTPTPTPAPIAPSTEDYTALRSQVRRLCINAVKQKKMNKADILAMFSQYKEGCDVVDNLPNESLTPIIEAIIGKGVTE